MCQRYSFWVETKYHQWCCLSREIKIFQEYHDKVQHQSHLHMFFTALLKSTEKKLNQYQILLTKNVDIWLNFSILRSESCHGHDGVEYIELTLSDQVRVTFYCPTHCTHHGDWKKTLCACVTNVKLTGWSRNNSYE